MAILDSAQTTAFGLSPHYTLSRRDASSALNSNLRFENFEVEELHRPRQVRYEEVLGEDRTRFNACDAAADNSSGFQTSPRLDGTVAQLQPVWLQTITNPEPYSANPTERAGQTTSSSNGRTETGALLAGQSDCTVSDTDHSSVLPSESPRPSASSSDSQNMYTYSSWSETDWKEYREVYEKHQEFRRNFYGDRWRLRQEEFFRPLFERN